MENFMIITENARGGGTTIILSSCYSYQVVTEFLKEYEKNGVMDKTGAKKRRSPYAVRLSGVESL